MADDQFFWSRFPLACFKIAMVVVEDRISCSFLTTKNAPPHHAFGGDTAGLFLLLDYKLKYQYFWRWDPEGEATRMKGGLTKWRSCEA